VTPKKRTKAKQGRPRKAPSEKKDAVLRVMLTAEQKKTLEEAAERAGMDVSTWVRVTALQTANNAAR